MGRISGDTALVLASAVALASTLAAGGAAVALWHVGLYAGLIPEAELRRLVASEVAAAQS